MNQLVTRGKHALLGLAVFAMAVNSWGAGFAARVYGVQFVSSDFEHLVSRDFMKKFPADKFEIFVLTDVTLASSDLAVCSATVGVVPLDSFEFPQHTYGAQGFQSVQSGLSNLQRKSIGMECLSLALKKMMGDNPAAVYVPAKKWI